MAVIVPATSVDAAANTSWSTLIHDLEVAQRNLAVVTSHLSKVEQRYYALPKRQRRGADPVWYLGAQEAETAAAADVEVCSHRIARARAQGREGLAIKIRLLATAYGEDPRRLESDLTQEDDLVAALIHSLIRDLS